MANLPIEEIEKLVGSRYALTVLAGKRARDLRDGAPQLVNSDSSNPILVALQEIYEGKVVPENLDLTAGIEQRAAKELEEATRVAREENTARLAQKAALANPPELLSLRVVEEPLALPVVEDVVALPLPEVASASPASFATTLHDDDVEVEEDDLSGDDDFEALDGNLLSVDPVNPVEE